jgi:hypothetical protein
MLPELVGKGNEKQNRQGSQILLPGSFAQSNSGIPALLSAMAHLLPILVARAIKLREP